MESTKKINDDILKNSDIESFRSGYTAPNAKVLVVDDNKMNRAVFKGLLIQTQMQIYEAESGKECLDKMKEQSFDLIFLDHMMPDMDGIKTLHEIKRQKLCEGVPVIILTANIIAEDKEKYLSEGFDDFLTKPVIPDKLDKMILKYLPESLIITTDLEMESRKLSKMDEFQEKLPEINLEQGFLICGGDKQFYLELFQDFTEMSVKDDLNQYLNAKDYNNYCIRIHGFKNSAYSMGAVAIGDMAYEIEKLTKDSFPEGIQEMQAQLFQEYDDICSRYREITK